jgi:predicted transporter
MTEAMKLLGIILLLAGLMMTAFTGIKNMTEKKVMGFDTSNSTKKEKTVYWSPVAGGILTVTGILLLFIDKKKIPS